MTTPAKSYFDMLRSQWEIVTSDKRPASVRVGAQVRMTSMIFERLDEILELHKKNTELKQQGDLLRQEILEVKTKNTQLEARDNRKTEQIAAQSQTIAAQNKELLRLRQEGEKSKGGYITFDDLNEIFKITEVVTGKSATSVPAAVKALAAHALREDPTEAPKEKKKTTSKPPLTENVIMQRFLDEFLNSLDPSSSKIESMVYEAFKKLREN